MNVSEKAKHGFIWLAVSQIFKPGLEFIVGIILARNLAPEYFGIVAIGSVFFGVAYIISNLGISNFLVQRNEINNELVKNCQSILLITAILLTGLGLYFSKYIGKYFEEPLSGTVYILFNINFVLSAFSTIPNAILSRNMLFKKISIVEIICTIAYSMLAILLVYLGYGIWSLVFPSILSSIVSLILLSFYAKYIPRFGLNTVIFREIIKFGSFITLSSLINYLARNIDYFLIGKFLGVHGLGIYKKSYDLIVLPKEKISDSIGRVYFSAINKIKNDTQWASSSWLKLNSTILYLILPVLLGLSSISYELVTIVYGENWIESVIPIRIMSIGGIFYCMIVPNNLIMIAFGKLKLYLVFQIIYLTLSIILISATIKNGIFGVSIAFNILMIILWLSSFYITKNIIPIKTSSFYESIKNTLMINFIMISVVFITGYLFSSKSLIFILISKIIAGFTIYFILSLTSKDKLIVEIKNNFQSIFRLKFNR